MQNRECSKVKLQLTPEEQYCTLQKYPLVSIEGQNRDGWVRGLTHKTANRGLSLLGANLHDWHLQVRLWRLRKFPRVT